MSSKIISEKEFNYIDTGRGTPLILLHGLMGSLSNFKDCIKTLPKKGFRVIMPILPIYELPLLKTNAKQLSLFLEKFINYMELQNFFLLGNSLGGHVGLIYSKTFPKKIAGLILTGSSGLYENALGGSFPKRGDYEFIKKKTAEVFFDPKYATKELVDEVFETINNRSKLIKILAMAKSAMRHNMKKDLEQINVPTCIIWGENDKITPPKVAEEFNQLLPNSKLFWIKKCGHAPMMEQSEEFNDIFCNWAKKIKT